MEQTVDPRERIIVALDVDNLELAREIVTELEPHVGCFKIGLELMTAVGGPTAVEAVVGCRGRVFYDGKFCDIPTTVGKSAKALPVGVTMFNVHASCGIDSMYAAVDNRNNAEVLAVTVLTSFEENDGHSTFGAPTKVKVLQYAREAVLAGCHGIICSPQELALIGTRRELRGLNKIVPGTRPTWADANDQKRVMTPSEAIMAGATALVIGRPITKPPTEVGGRIEAVKRITAEIEIALAELAERAT